MENVEEMFGLRDPIVIGHMPELRLDFTSLVGDKQLTYNVRSVDKLIHCINNTIAKYPTVVTIPDKANRGHTKILGRLVVMQLTIGPSEKHIEWYNKDTTSDDVLNRLAGAMALYPDSEWWTLPNCFIVRIKPDVYAIFGPQKALGAKNGNIPLLEIPFGDFNVPV